MNLGGSWLASNLESILTNLKPGESSIIEFPNLAEKKPNTPNYGVLNNVPICFTADKLYFAIQGN